MKKTHAILLFGISAVFMAFTTPNDSLRKKHFNLDSDKLALQGYDPVAYFVSNKAIEGNRSIFFIYHSVKYFFSTNSNLEKFKKSPESYEPAYGGWCAYAMGNSGEKVEVDPETFKIVQGKLYLFYNAFFNNTKTKWNADESSLMKKADLNWNKLYK